MKKSNTISSILFILLLLFFSFVWLPFVDAFQRDISVSISFLIIGFLSAMGMVVSSAHKPFSIRFVFYFYCFSFLFCAGITQFASKKFCWEFAPTTTEVLQANIFIVAFILIFAASSIRVLPKNLLNANKGSFLVNNSIVCKDGWLLGIELLMLICGGYAVARGGFGILLSRELFEESSFSALINNSAMRQVVLSAINAACMFCVVLSLSNLKKRRTIQSYVFFIASLIALLINVPPLAVPRFTFAGVYGGVFLYFSNRIKKGKRFAYILSFGLLIIFPILNAFRYVSNDLDLNLIEESLGEITNNFTKADYDSYTMLLYSIRYINVYGVTYGKQLLGTILFFIPRAFWPQKPGGSGALIIERLAPPYINPNVSCSIIGEGLMNFGFVGVVLFSFVIGKISKAMDDLYWNRMNRVDGCYGYMYPYITLFSLLLFRGDLMSSTAFLIGMVAVTIFLSVLFRGETEKETYRSLDN